MARADFVKALISTELQARVLVASHHGNASGVYQPFLKLFAPTLTIIPAKHGYEFTNPDVYRNASSGRCVYHQAKKRFPALQGTDDDNHDYVFIWVDSANQDVHVSV